MKRFEKGKKYPLEYKSRVEQAGNVEVVDIEYFNNPKETSDDGIVILGTARIKYVDTKYYKNKLFDAEIVGYLQNRFREKEKTCISLDNKFYFSVFLN